LNINLSETRKKTVSASQYINSLEEPFKEKFLARKQAYLLNKETISQLKKFANTHVVVAFSAGWCKDCSANIPVLALISEATGLEVRIFGHLKRDTLSHNKKWRIPPSPPEVETFNVDKIPLMIVFDQKGEDIGRIIENPVTEPTLEQELLRLILGKH
jgi:thiol-disulfide isomerase/thioredoxin